MMTKEMARENVTKYNAQRGQEQLKRVNEYLENIVSPEIKRASTKGREDVTVKKMMLSDDTEKACEELVKLGFQIVNETFGIVIMW